MYLWKENNYFELKRAGSITLSFRIFKKKRAEKKVVPRRYLEKMAKIYSKDEIERGEYSASQGYFSIFFV